MDCWVILIAVWTDTAFSGCVVAASEQGHALGKPLPGTPEWIRSTWKNRIRRCRSSTRVPAGTPPAMTVSRKARIGRNPSAADPWMRHETLASGDGQKTRWPAGAIRHQVIAGLARRSQVADSGTCVVLGLPCRRRRIRRRQPSPRWLSSASTRVARHRPSGRLRGNPAGYARRIPASLLLRGARQAKAAFLSCSFPATGRSPVAILQHGHGLLGFLPPHQDVLSGEARCAGFPSTAAEDDSGEPQWDWRMPVLLEEGRRRQRALRAEPETGRLLVAGSEPPCERRPPGSACACWPASCRQRDGIDRPTTARRIPSAMP